MGASEVVSVVTDAVVEGSSVVTLGTSVGDVASVVERRGALVDMVGFSVKLEAVGDVGAGLGAEIEDAVASLDDIGASVVVDVAAGVVFDTPSSVASNVDVAAVDVEPNVVTGTICA